MRPLVSCEVVPVTVEKVGEDLPFDLAGRESGVSLLITAVSGSAVLRANRGAIRIDRRRENDGLGIRRPLRIVGLGCDARQLLRMARGASRGIEIGKPNLLAILSPRKEKHGVPVSRELNAGVARLANRQ